MKNRLKIELRKKQYFFDQDPLQPVLVTCVGGVPAYIPGTIPDNDWIDFTQHTEGLKDINLKWSATQDFGEGAGTEKDRNEIGSNYQKGLSADLKFHGPAFKFIFDWLMTDECQILNSVEALITDMECKRSYRIFELKLDNTNYSPEDNCIVALPLREKDDVIHSFQKTIIEDNWQGWFNQDGTSTKDHPTFSFIVEKKPKLYLAIYAAVIYILGILSTGILVAINDGKKWIRRTLGFTYFCPSPLIRTYIENICAKYGYTFDTMFDDKPENPYRDAVLFFPASKTYKNFADFDSPSTKYIWENRTVYPFAKFLNALKDLFNAEWYVTPNKQLVFKHQSYFDNKPPLHDFTAGNDKIYNLNYTFNGRKKPAYGDYQYQVDPQDSCSNELKWRYNDVVDYDGPANNPMLEGHVTRSFEFAMTAFHNDGSSEDFLEEGVKVGRLIAIGAMLLGLGELFLAANPLTAAIVAALLTTGYIVTDNYVNDFFNNADLNGMVRSGSSEINIPRVLLWDRTTDLDKAKVVYVEDPAVNLFYNPDNVDYYTEHPTHDGNVFGTTVTRVYNYPMYIDAKFTNNLFDRFHEYDNPLKNPVVNQTWTGEVDLCCEWLERLGTFEPDFIQIGAVFVLEKRGTRLIRGRVMDIQPDYKKGNIQLSGIVLK